MMRSGTAFGRKGIRADCNHLIEHTVRNVEHCAPTLAPGLLISEIYGLNDFYIVSKKFDWLISECHGDVVSFVGKTLNISCF